MNHNIPSFKALMRRSWITKNDQDNDTYDDVYVFGIQSVGGKILTFHVMTNYGMLRTRVPISEIFTKVPSNDIPYYYKQLWDCYDETCEVHRFDYLIGLRCQVKLRDKSMVWATYMFTVDWYNNPSSEEASDYKCAHVLQSDDGYLLAMPNNRLFWRDSNWITQDFPIPLKDIKTDIHIPSVESVSDVWVSENSDCYYYEINKYETNTDNSYSTGDV